MHNIIFYFIFLVPILLILWVRSWRNPIYLIPLLIPVALFAFSNDWITFLNRLLCFTSILAFYFCFAETRWPWVLIEFLLIETKFFEGFKEAYWFKRTVMYFCFYLFPIIGGILSYQLTKSF